MIPRSNGWRLARLDSLLAAVCKRWRLIVWGGEATIQPSQTGSNRCSEEKTGHSRFLSAHVSIRLWRTAFTPVANGILTSKYDLIVTNTRKDARSESCLTRKRLCLFFERGTSAAPVEHKLSNY